MSKMVSVRLDEGLVESLRARAEREGKSAAWVVGQALTLYLAVTPKPEQPAPPESLQRRTAAPMAAPTPDAVPSSPVCRHCRHPKRLHSNTGVLSGSGCDYMGCSCRRFVAGE